MVIQCVIDMGLYVDMSAHFSSYHYSEGFSR